MTTQGESRFLEGTIGIRQRICVAFTFGIYLNDIDFFSYGATRNVDTVSISNTCSILP